MARPPSVDGGRPNQITIRFSDQELAALDARRGNLRRPDYIRRAALADPVALRASRATVRDDPEFGHTHDWTASPQRIVDNCGCGATRPHQAGTRP